MTKNSDLQVQLERALKILEEGGADPELHRVVLRTAYRAMLGQRDGEKFFCLASVIEPDSPLPEFYDLLLVEDMAARALCNGVGVILAFDHPACGRASAARIQQLAQGARVLVVDWARK